MRKATDTAFKFVHSIYAFVTFWYDIFTSYVTFFQFSPCPCSLKFATYFFMLVLINIILFRLWVLYMYI